MSPPRPHPLSRSKAARWADYLLAKIWERGLTEKPPLDPDHLWEIGARGFETEDEISIRSPDDVADFRERLEILCRSLREEARLNSLGHTMAYGQITGAIRRRHALGRIWRDKPTLAETEIPAPILVIGQMRSGTTRVHRLLAADPRHAGTRFCDSHNPVPQSPDWRPLKASAGLALARLINPWLDTLHPFGATRIDEEIGWLSGALSPCAFEAQWHIPSFVGFSEARDPAPVYREFARILRTDAAVMGNASRPRILKCPQFAEDLPSLLRQFPDAWIALAERDRNEVWESSVSLVASQTAFQSDEADLSTIEQEWQRKLTLRADRMDTALNDFDGPLARIGFEDLNTDWRAAIFRTYDAFGIAMTRDAIAAMESERNRSARDLHHLHVRNFAQVRSEPPAAA